MNVSLLQGDCLEILRTLPEESVHCVVTSPPYWGLRDYGVAGQIGLEKTPEEYVAKMVEVFQEVRRVLRKDGTCWVNLGDSYNGSGAGGGGNRKGNEHGQHDAFSETGRPFADNLKPKDLCGIPWRVAFALQADGWYLRQDIIWSKPNPMPESVTDRCTKAHEYIFLLSKSASYFYDAEAVKEQSSYEESGNIGPSRFAVVDPVKGRLRANLHEFQARPTRNRRSVWTVPSQPYPESHFATFPEDLIKPCILAGASARGCCSKCGGPWERITQPTSEYQSFVDSERERKGNRSMRDGLECAPGLTRGTGNKSVSAQRETLGWQPTCDCGDAQTIPCTVLDPFGGSGTTGQVSLELGRNAILIELNPDYVTLAQQRTFVTPGLPLA